MAEGELTSYRYAYTPTGEAYGFKHRYSHEQLTRSYVTHGPYRNHVQNLYTGKYAEALTGLSHMDARWYDAQKGRFIQGDQYNHANLMLLAGAQSELMRYIGRSQSDLLRDPAQQMQYGYVAGRFMVLIDPLGLEEYFVGGGGDKSDFWSLNGLVGSGNMETTMKRANAKQLTSGETSYWGYEQEDELLKTIVENYKNGDKEVKLTGHSFGASAVIRIANDLENSEIEVDRLILLDRVSTFDSSNTTTNAKIQINVYQKQTVLDGIANIPIVGNVVAGALSWVNSLVTDSRFDDVVATTGGQVGPSFDDRALNIETDFHHAESSLMYYQALAAENLYNSTPAGNANSPYSFNSEYSACYE